MAAKNWLKEERRKTLGDWVAFCLGCGHTVRYVDGRDRELPARCPSCGGELRSTCPSCGARFSSAFAVTCETCGDPLRPAELLGIRIRKERR